jgi:uncharacterized protein
VVAIDALRGYVMLGVAVVNAHAFNNGLDSGNYAWDLALTARDRAGELISNLFFAHRSLPLLAFLLGVGLVMQTRSLDRVKVSTVLFRRYLALLAIGVLHGLLLWPGEILAAYAFIVLVLARYSVTWSIDTLKSVIAAFVAFSFGLSLYWALTDSALLQCSSPAIFAQTSFAQSNWLAARQLGVTEFIWAGLIGQGLNVNIWALMLIGVWCARLDTFWQHLREPSFRQPLVAVSVVVLAVSTALEWQFGRAGGWSSLGCSGQAVSRFVLFETTTMFACVPVVLTLFAWLAKRSAGAAWFKQFVAVGRAPLTMFIGQSVVFTLLFNKTFIGLHGEVGRFGVLVAAVLTYAVLAVWIDRRYARRGLVAPAERGWRKLYRRSGA